MGSELEVLHVCTRPETEVVSERYSLVLLLEIRRIRPMCGSSQAFRAHPNWTDLHPIALEFLGKAARSFVAEITRSCGPHAELARD